MSRPVAARGYRYPGPLFADDDPWIARWGIGGPVCCCCGAGLTRRALEDTDGRFWGADCYRRATGRPAPARMIPAAPVVQLVAVARSGVTIRAGAAVQRFAIGEAPPPELVQAFSAADRRRWDRYAAKHLAQGDRR